MREVIMMNKENNGFKKLARIYDNENGKITVEVKNKGFDKAEVITENATNLIKMVWAYRNMGYEVVKA